MTNLTIEQSDFLEKLVNLHRDTSNTYSNSWSVFTHAVYHRGYYDTSGTQPGTLNKVAKQYITWKKKQARIERALKTLT